MSLLQRIRSTRGWRVATKRQLLTISLIVAITVGTVAMAGGVLVYLESRMMERAGNSLAAVAANLTEKLDLLLFERYGDVQMMALMLGATVRDAQAQTQYLNQVKEIYLYYRWLAVTDAQGKIVAATDPASVGQDRSEAIWFQAARDSRQVHLLDAQVSPEAGEVPAVGLSAPISGAKGEFLGVVTARVRLSELEDTLARTIQSFTLLQSGRARVEWQFLAHDGTLVSDSLLREEGMNLQALGVTSARLVSRTAEPGFVAEEHGRRHVPVVTGYARTEGYAEFPGFQWSVLVRMDREDVLAPIWNVLRVVAGLGVLVFSPMIGLLLWTVNRLRKEWAVALEEKAHATVAEAKFRGLLEFAPDASVIVNQEGRIVLVNLQAEKLFGYAREELIGQSVEMLVPEGFRSQHVGHRALYAADPRPRPMGACVGLFARRKNGSNVSVDISLGSLMAGDEMLMTAAIRDITERKRTENELHESQEQLRQAQKMESVGRLAGGIAHDFNNLLMVVSGYSQIILGRLGADDPLRGEVEEIAKAGDRAAVLTRQLLAFSRQQVLQPKVLDLNALVVNMEGMLSRVSARTSHCVPPPARGWDMCGLIPARSSR